MTKQAETLADKIKEDIAADHNVVPTRNYTPLEEHGRMRGLGEDDISRQDLQDAYEQRVVILFHIIIWMNNGKKLEKFPYKTYGLSEDSWVDNFLYPVSEHGGNFKILKKAAKKAKKKLEVIK